MRLGKARLLASAAALISALSTLATDAAARAEAEARYSKAQTYSAALRYLRVDLGYEVLEKDPDAAYLLFKYQVPGQSQQTSMGAIEIVDASEAVRIFVKLAKMPEYHERVLRDGLLKKLRDEYGAPPPPPRPKKPEPPSEEQPSEKPSAER